MYCWIHFSICSHFSFWFQSSNCSHECYCIHYTHCSHFINWLHFLFCSHIKYWLHPSACSHVINWLHEFDCSHMYCWIHIPDCSHKIDWLHLIYCYESMKLFGRYIVLCPRCSDGYGVLTGSPNFSLHSVSSIMTNILIMRRKALLCTCPLNIILSLSFLFSSLVPQSGQYFPVFTFTSLMHWGQIFPFGVGIIVLPSCSALFSRYRLSSR